MSTHGSSASSASSVAERARRYSAGTAAAPKTPSLSKNGKPLGRPPNPTSGLRRQYAMITSKMNGAQDRADRLRRASGAAQRAGNTALRDQLLARAERAQNRYRALRSQRDALNYTPPEIRSH